MPTTTFDPRLRINNVDVMTGKFLEVRVVQGVQPGHVSNMIIDTTKPFDIELEWQIDGQLFNVNGVLGNINAPNNWFVFVYAEKMGPGDDLEIYRGTEPGADVVTTLPATWTHTCTIPAGTLPEHFPEAGLYRLCACVFANTTVAGSHDIVGFHEGPMIMSENPA